MKRKTPWHSPSECSFNHGYRVGFLAGRISGVKFGLNHAGNDCWKEIRKAKIKQKDWKEGRPT
jgi:hypothetical protein